MYQTNRALQSLKKISEHCSPRSDVKVLGSWFIIIQFILIVVIFVLLLNYFALGGESFEGFGENETNEQVSGGGIDLVLAPHINNSSNHM